MINVVVDKASSVAALRRSVRRSIGRAGERARARSVRSTPRLHWRGCGARRVSKAGAPCRAGFAMEVALCAPPSPRRKQRPIPAAAKRSRGRYRARPRKVPPECSWRRLTWPGLQGGARPRCERQKQQHQQQLLHGAASDAPESAEQRARRRWRSRARARVEPPPARRMGYAQDVAQVARTILSEYGAKTDRRLKLIDCYLVFCLCTAAAQVRPRARGGGDVVRC
eukprot:scaffold4956_cov233-Prasinococcus_capsulatus_cf.AAC.1